MQLKTYGLKPEEIIWSGGSGVSTAGWKHETSWCISETLPTTMSVGQSYQTHGKPTEVMVGGGEGGGSCIP